MKKKRLKRIREEEAARVLLFTSLILLKIKEAETGLSLVLHPLEQLASFCLWRAKNKIKAHCAHYLELLPSGRSYPYTNLQMKKEFFPHSYHHTKRNKTTKIFTTTMP